MAAATTHPKATPTVRSPSTPRSPRSRWFCRRTAGHQGRVTGYASTQEEQDRTQGGAKDGFAPAADKPLNTTELLAQIVREDLSELDKVRLLQDNMPESMTPERAAILTSILGQLAQAVSSEDGQAAHGQVKGLMRKMTALMFKPTRPDPVRKPPSSSRAAILLEFVRAMHAALPNEMSRMQWATEEATVEAASMLLGGLNEAREQLLAAGAGDVTGL